MKKNITQKYWEERAKQYKFDVRGVLFKKPYPQFVNVWFHNWSLEQVMKIVSKEKKMMVLDIACGWGRLSAPLLNHFSKLSIVGIDISKPYVEFYNQLLSPRGKAQFATMEKMPFKDKTIDAAFLVVSLMYLPSEKQQKLVMEEIFRVLKKKGRLILIERTPLMALLDIKKRNHKQISFTKSVVESIVTDSKCRIANIHSWPISLIPLYNAYLIENR